MDICGLWKVREMHLVTPDGEKVFTADSQVDNDMYAEIVQMCKYIMLVSIPPYMSVAQFMGYPKGKSSLMIFDRHANLKYKYGSRNFWCRGYYVDTVGRNKRVIEEYIRNQLEEDFAQDQMSIKEYIDPFTGAKNK